jgi:sugar-specific transcriptional regulator TrmB
MRGKGRIGEFMKVTREIELTFTTKARRKVEVTFPLYRKHDLDSDHSESVIYTRIDADFREVSIHITKPWSGHEVTYELEIDSRSGNLSQSSDADYTLGRGAYECSES